MSLTRALYYVTTARTYQSVMSIVVSFVQHTESKTGFCLSQVYVVP